MKKIVLVFAFVVNIFAVMQAKAENKTNRQAVVITNIVDGDTVDATLLEKKRNVRIRLADIDCPEKNKKNGKFYKQANEWKLSENELKEKGKLSKEKLEAIIKLNSEDIYFEEKPENVCKGEQRAVGVLWTGDGMNINEYMLKKAGCKPSACSEK